MRSNLVNAGLICEGGGMRGIYVAGVLEFFMEKGIIFSSCYGVSAGSCHLASYISGQRGRAYRVAIDHLKERDYCSAYSLVKTGDLFGADYCYNRIPNELNPYDYDAADRYPGKVYAVATDIVTGRPAYFRMTNMRRDLLAVRASSSLPMVSKNVVINGREYLDGGMSDSVPIIRSVHDGNEKNVVILTRPAGYRKKPTSNMQVVRAMYKDYPKLVEDMEKRHIRYNRTMEYLEKEEAEGRAFVFRPELLVKIDRIEKNEKKLKLLYMQGYYDAAQNYEKMMKFLQE